MYYVLFAIDDVGERRVEGVEEVEGVTAVFLSELRVSVVNRGLIDVVN